MVNKLDKTAARDTRTPRVFLKETASANRNRKRSNIDDIIVSLADAHENRRARQVVEWVRQQSVRRAS